MRIARRGAATDRGGSEAVPLPLASGAGQPLPLLRPLEIGELLDEAFDLYRHNFPLFFGIAVLLDLPITTLQIAFASPTRIFSWADWLAVSVLPVTFCALTVAQLERILGRETSILAAYRQTARRGLRLFMGTLVYVLAIAGLFAVLILPGALLVQSSPILASLLLVMGVLLIAAPLTVLSLWGMLLMPVIVAENRGAGALARCWRLASRDLWRLFFLSMGLTLVVVISFFVFAGLRGLAQALTGINTWLPPDRTDPAQLFMYAGVTLTEALVLDALIPIALAACALAYVDLRIRREAFDLELLASGLDARIAARSATAAGPETVASAPSGAPGTAPP